MRPHKILKDFSGNQTGIGETQLFKEGTIALLSDQLSAVVVPAGFAEPADEAMVENRETKVTGPDETKPEKKKKGTK